MFVGGTCVWIADDEPYRLIVRETCVFQIGSFCLSLSLVYVAELVEACLRCTVDFVLVCPWGCEYVCVCRGPEAFRRGGGCRVVGLAWTLV